ncbi:MAG: glycosyltransferase family A protein [Patescibacteria group bacterium]|jgi:glycosyltransferase involved in cell wall biosynthesis|nr:glycosyltransferase family A protein [Patescibacteria group bacterium]
MSQIDIIIPVYNAQRTLKRCLESIFNQTFSDYKIIAVNDGSTDNSLKILENYRSQITIINQANHGAAHARNQGAKIASAPFIIFIDADIIAQPMMLEKMYQALQKHPEVSYAYSSFKFGFKTFKLWPFDAEKLKQTPYIHTSSLIRAKDFPGFDEKLRRFQDWDLWLRMNNHGHPGYFIDQVLFKVISGGTMSSWLPKFAYRLNFLNQTKKYQAAKEIIIKKHNL